MKKIIFLTFLVLAILFTGCLQKSEPTATPTETSRLTNLPFHIGDITLKKGMDVRIGADGQIVDCSGMMLYTLYLGKGYIPLMTPYLTSDCMIQTRDFGNLQLMRDKTSDTWFILVTQKQEKLFDQILGIKDNQAPITPTSKSDKGELIIVGAIIVIFVIAALSFSLWYRHRKKNSTATSSERDAGMIDQQSASNRDSKQSLYHVSKRNVLVTACLTIVLIASLFAASIYVYYFDTDELEQISNGSVIIKNAPFIMVLLNIVFLILLLARKMIGFFGVATIGTIAFLLYIFKGVGFYWFIGPAEIAILFGILQIKKNDISAWNNLI